MNIAAIVYQGDQGTTVDTLLADVAYRLRASGWKLAGAVQAPDAPRNSRCEMTLEDLATGACIEMSDELGPTASGCRLDTEALGSKPNQDGVTMRRDWSRARRSAKSDAYASVERFDAAIGQSRLTAEPRGSFARLVRPKVLQTIEVCGDLGPASRTKALAS